MGLFDEIYDRFHSRSVKWDALADVFQTNDVLPMWVADMDFKAPDEVNRALIKRAEHGIYGYTVVDNHVKDAIISWQKRRNNWDIKQEWLSFSPGVVTSLNLAIQAYTDPGDKVLIQTPVYTPFYNVIKNHDRSLVTNPLLREDNHYQIDFADLEKKLQSGVKAMILCSPHNPVGRVWTKEELAEIARLCIENDVVVISDEIHADLTFPKVKHTPIASISKEISNRCVTCMAPSKTFNLAGLQASYIITENDDLKKKFDEQLSKQGLGSLNTMGNFALEAAYTYGDQWLDELKALLHSHTEYVMKAFEQATDKIRVIQPEGTYLLWLDCSGMNMTSEELKAFMIKEAKVGLNAGVSYGEEGNQFMRMNIACPAETLHEGVNRILEAVKRHESVHA